MKPWQRWTLLTFGILAILYLGVVAAESFPHGDDVDVTIHVGAENGAMYLRCDPAASSPGVCSGGDQATVTVPHRARVHMTVVNDDGGDRTHDFRVEGWQYLLPPVRPEMELHKPTQTHTFTAWASGSFDMVCELKGHEAAGMRGTLVVS